MSREKHSAVRYWAVIVALVSIISNLIFSSLFSSSVSMRVNSIFYCVWFFGWVGVFSESL